MDESTLNKYWILVFLFKLNYVTLYDKDVGEQLLLILCKNNKS